jgi:hypothetical protein
MLAIESHARVPYLEPTGREHLYAKRPLKMELIDSQDNCQDRGYN